MAIVMTKQKGVPRRLYGFHDDEPRLDPVAAAFPDSPELTDAEVLSPEEVPVTYSPCEAAEEVPDDVVESPGYEHEPASPSMGTLLSLPFFTYLTFTTRLPLWARLLSGAIGVRMLVGEGGVIQALRARASSEAPLFSGHPRRRLRGYGDITFTQGRGLGSMGCGCGCNGKPGGCGG